MSWSDENAKLWEGLLDTDSMIEIGANGVGTIIEMENDEQVNAHMEKEAEKGIPDFRFCNLDLSPPQSPHIHCAHAGVKLETERLQRISNGDSKAPVLASPQSCVPRCSYADSQSFPQIRCQPPSPIHLHSRLPSNRPTSSLILVVVCCAPYYISYLCTPQHELSLSHTHTHSLSLS